MNVVAEKNMKTVDFSFATREDSKEMTAQIGDENNPRRHVPACARPASEIAVPAGESHEEPPPPSPRLLERQQPWLLFERNANNIREAKASLAQPQQDNMCSGRERLKRHRDEVAGQVLIPDSWGQERFLKDWMDYSVFDALLAPNGIASAREALMAEAARRGKRLLIRG